MDLGLKGRVAIVTGSSQGIGKSIAQLLSLEGALTVICARAFRLDMSIIQFMLKLPKLDKRTAILWVITGLVAGSISASLSDMVGQNAWFLVYGGLIVGWLLVLTAIASIHVKESSVGVTT